MFRGDLVVTNAGWTLTGMPDLWDHSFDAIAGGGDEILVGTVDLVALGNEEREYTGTAHILGSGDGLTIRTSTLKAPDGPRAWPMPDATGDGLAELAWQSGWPTQTVRVERATDGTAVWQRELGGFPRAFGDLDGDGVEELSLAVTDSQAPFEVLDGATGVTRVRAAARHVYRDGDLNGDTKPEVGAITTTSTGLRLRGFTAAGTRVRNLALGTAFPYAEAAPVGDVTGDGIIDVHVLGWPYHPNGGPEWQGEQVVDGKTGAVLWSRQTSHDYWTESHLLRAFSDGPATDLLRVTRMEEGGSILSAVNARTGTQRWGTTLDIGGNTNVVSLRRSADYDADGFPEVTAAGQALDGASFEYVLSGASGAVLWRAG
jgi:outer membrane protein assembly factor BamB